MPNDFFHSVHSEILFNIYFTINATFVSYSTYLSRICVMLDICSALTITDFHTTEYYMLHFRTFKNTELTK